MKKIHQITHHRGQLICTDIKFTISTASEHYSIVTYYQQKWAVARKLPEVFENHWQFLKMNRKNIKSPRCLGLRKGSYQF
jgi:hypothetical protein